MSFWVTRDLRACQIQQYNSGSGLRGVVGALSIITIGNHTWLTHVGGIEQLEAGPAFELALCGFAVGVDLALAGLAQEVCLDH